MENENSPLFGSYNQGNDDTVYIFGYEQTVGKIQPCPAISDHAVGL